MVDAVSQQGEKELGINVSYLLLLPLNDILFLNHAGKPKFTFPSSVTPQPFFLKSTSAFNSLFC